MPKLDINKLNKLKRLSKQVRIDCLMMTMKAKASHIGSNFSIVEMLISIYFIYNNPKKIKNNSFILSKGHASASLYSLLSHLGKIERSKILDFCKNNSKLSGHVTNILNGIYFSTGSLGHGLPVATGIALSKKKKKENIFVIISDGELNEGTTWEAALFAAHNNLNNLKVFIDKNKIQSFGSTKEVLNTESIEKKWESFNWQVFKIDGHNYNEYFKIKRKLLMSKKPCVIICDTVKGKGVSFMENNLDWHYKSINQEQFKLSINEINEK